jgi:hypothetical protein
MSCVPYKTTMVSVQLDRLLESAVVLSWTDLVHPFQRGIIQIEYAAAARLPYLKVWQLTAKGQWSLVGEYWMERGATGIPVEGMTFSNDYHSAGLAEMLEFIMQHQDSFATLSLAPMAGSIQISPPTEQENLAAGACMRHAYESFGFDFAHVAEATIA